MKHHRWSGWPGAFCLNCGSDDPTEWAIANDLLDPYTNEWLGTEEEKKEYDKACVCTAEIKKRNDRENICR